MISADQFVSSFKNIVATDELPVENTMFFTRNFISCPSWEFILLLLNTGQILDVNE